MQFVNILEFKVSKSEWALILEAPNSDSKRMSPMHQSFKANFSYSKTLFLSYFEVE